MNDSSLPKPSRTALLTTELLVEHAGWIRALARKLVTDADLADQLAQETMVVALEHPPRDSQSIRSWFQRVLRNLFSEHLRAGSARSQRENTTARTEGLPATDELVERVQTQRRVADCLLKLEEPYRSTVLFRYYEDLPPRQIAEQQGLPVATVKSRLNRGLAMLRSEMDGDFGGDRSAWVLALMPWSRDLLPMSINSPFNSLGGLVVNAKLWIATAGLIAATSGWMWLRESDLAQPVVAEPASIDSALPAQVSQSSTTQPSNGSEREARIESVMESSPATQSPDEIPIVVKAKYEVRGRVLDSDGQAVDGLSVRLRGENNTAVTSGGGTFTIATSAQASTIEVADETWVTVRAGSWTHNAEIEPVVVIARAIELTGTVLDEWGSPVNGARVVIALPDNFETRFDHVIDASFSQEWSARTVDDGSFTMNRLPAISGAELRTVHDRFAPNVQDTPLSSSDLSIVLRRPLVPTEFALNGVVMHADGTTATEALVALGNTSVRSDKDGQFTIDLRQADDAQTLRAIETGHQPAILERPSKPSEDSSGWPNFVVLQLGPAALTIEGRVVDSDGKPLGGGRVWVGNSSRFGAVGKIPVRLEALMAGGAVPKEAVDSLAFDVSETDGGGTYGSARPLFEPDALVYWVVTDNNGRFELPGLTARDYTLHVLDTKLHWGTISDPIAAGSAGVEIVVPIEASYDVLRGQIVTEQGDGVPGVRITPWLGAVHMLEPVRGGDADVLRFFLGPSTTSDDEGLFELRGVPRRHVQFHIVSDEIVPSYASVEEVTDPDDFTITVLARIHIEVSVGPGPNSPNAFRVTDESGAVVTMLKMRADGYSHQEQVELTNGRSGVVTLTTDATMLDFLRDGLVVDSIPISPRPGQTLRINR